MGGALIWLRWYLKTLFKPWLSCQPEMTTWACATFLLCLRFQRWSWYYKVKIEFDLWVCNHFQLPWLKNLFKQYLLNNNLFKQYLMPIRRVQLWLGQERLGPLSSLLSLGPCSWLQDTAYNCKTEEQVKTSVPGNFCLPGLRV